MPSPIIEDVIPVVSIEDLDQVEMTFSEAMDEVINGKVITKIEWKNRDIFCLLKSGILQIHIDGQFKNWIISDGDMLGTDWIVLTK